MKVKNPTNQSDLIKAKYDIEYSSTEHELTKAHSSDSGYEIKADVSSEVRLDPGEMKSIDTGIRLKLPKGIEAQIRPRSGLALNYGITVLNSPGTIDQGYRREMKVILINHGKEPYIIQKGDKIAQLVFSTVLTTILTKVKQIDTKSSERKENFGSTEKSENTNEPETKKLRSGGRSRSRKIPPPDFSPQLPMKE